MARGTSPYFPSVPVTVEVEPILYTVTLHSEWDEGLPVVEDTYYHVTGWNIEGDFICIYDLAHTKTAYRMSEKVNLITTTEETGKVRSHESVETLETETAEKPAPVDEAAETTEEVEVSA
jgi:hypothetical protein